MNFMRQTAEEALFDRNRNRPLGRMQNSSGDCRTVRFQLHFWQEDLKYFVFIGSGIPFKLKGKLLWAIVLLTNFKGNVCLL